MSHRDTHAPLVRRARRRRVGFPSALLLALALATAACGIGENVTDGCGMEERDYEAARSLRDGMRDRGVDADDSAYRRALDELARARSLLTECRASG